MTFDTLSDEVQVIEHQRTPAEPWAFVWSVPIGGKNLQVIRISEDRSTGKWWHRAKVLGDLEAAQKHVQARLPDLLRETIFKAMTPRGFEFCRYENGEPIYRTDDGESWRDFTWNDLSAIAQDVGQLEMMFGHLIRKAGQATCDWCGEKTDSQGRCWTCQDWSRN